ncbi:unnamed protein product, partial [Effrenium voratum]
MRRRRSRQPGQGCECWSSSPASAGCAAPWRGHSSRLGWWRPSTSRSCVRRPTATTLARTTGKRRPSNACDHKTW